MLPFGFGVFLYKIFTLNDSDKDNYYNYLTPFVFLYSNDIILCPLSLVFVLEKKPVAKFFAPCCPDRFGSRADPQLKPKSTIALKELSANLRNKNGNKRNVIVDSVVVDEMSRISTVEVTVLSEKTPRKFIKIVWLKHLTNAQGYPMPAMKTLTQSKLLETTTVECYSEIKKPVTESEIARFKRNCEALI